MTNTDTNAADIFGYDVMTSDGSKIGTVDGVWVDDATNELEFVAVKTGFLFGKNHIIPTADAQITNGSVTLPYTEDQIKNAPSFGTDQELSPDQEQEVYSYYGVDRSMAASPTGLPSGEGTGFTGTTDTTPTSYAETGTTGYAGTGTTDRENLTLSEEELQVGKREVEAGRVRLRKVVHTERQEVPVELRHEDVQIERIPASEATAPADAFQEREIDVPVMREEAVVAKEARVTGQVNVNKTVDTETRTVGEDVRSEDVVVDEDSTNTVGSGLRREAGSTVHDTDDPTPSY